MKPAKTEPFRFRKNKGIVMYNEFIDFARYVSKQLGFQITVDGMEIKETPQGVHIKGGMGQATSQSCAFDGAVVTEESFTNFKFSKAGQIFPYGIPDNMVSSGELLTLAIPSSGTAFIKLSVSTDGYGNIVGAYILWDSSPAAPIGITEEYPPEEFEINLYMILNGTAHRLIGCGDISVEPHVALITSREDATCSEDPLIRHYTWSIN